MRLLGVDIGGSEIKAAPVDLDTGRLCEPAFRVATPRPSTPREVGSVIDRAIQHFEWTGGIGCALPGPIVDSVIRDPGHLDAEWCRVDAQQVLEAAVDREITVLNDADAAGLAEMAFGAGRGHDGTVVMLTFGTGIGSALFRDGALVPNTEFGIVNFEEGPAERFASAGVRTAKNLSYGEWADRVSAFVNHLAALLYPDLIIIGGAISAAWEEFGASLDIPVPVVPAAYGGDAGIVGAAIAAASVSSPRAAMPGGASA